MVFELYRLGRSPFVPEVKMELSDFSRKGSLCVPWPNVHHSFGHGTVYVLNLSRSTSHKVRIISQATRYFETIFDAVNI